MEDIDAPSIRFPSGYSFPEPLVGENQTPIMSFLVLVSLRGRRRISAAPESSDELVAAGVVGERLELLAFSFRDDPYNFFLEPSLIFVLGVK